MSVDKNFLKPTLEEVDLSRSGGSIRVFWDLGATPFIDITKSQYEKIKKILIEKM